MSKKVKPQKRQEPHKVKDNTRVRMSWYNMTIDLFLLEVVGRFFRHYSSQV